MQAVSGEPAASATKKLNPGSEEKNGAPGRVRTRDPLITNQVLYQLSYKGNPVQRELAYSAFV
ncbi:protein of unknown function [Pseudorhizobium banfieldiae]|uniref:Uncharacterized protein n=1 Tax=Pseudorhizobium banfieldiae TaxID=1125847 RepID=L0NDC1_9HYPH|nr:protein of unknown function [Pseudorhizobium banfieldiae]